MRSLLFGICMALSFSMASSAAQNGRVTGTVTDDSGDPLVGANVMVIDGNLKKITGTITGADGGYRIDNLVPGRYRISASFVGYADGDAQEIELAAGATVVVDVTLSSQMIFLEQSVVTTSRRREKVLDSPASVSVVEGDEIRSNPVLAVTEHVRDLPGVDFAQNGLVQSNIVTRGFNNIFSGALLTLTDNRIARVPSLRLNANNFIPLTNDDIERIEVVLGPGSALYGPNSANGVLHIITRSPFTSVGTDVSVGIGERSLRKTSLRHAGVSGKLGYKISGEYYTGTDWKSSDAEEASARLDDPTLPPRDFDVVRQGAEVRLDYKAGEDLSAILAAGFNRGDYIELTGLGAAQAIDWAYNYVQLRLNYRDWFAQVFRNWSDAGDTFLLRDNDDIIDKSDVTAFQVQHFASLGERQRFTYGADLMFTRPDTEGSITGRNEENDDINEFGAYLQSETELNRQLQLVLALRYDDHNRIEDTELSPRAALVYKPRDDQTVRLTYNRAFSTPTTLNLYLDRRAQRDPFGLTRFGVEQGIDVRAQGTYHRGATDGFSFQDCASGPCFRSPFAPLAGRQASDYIDMNDPVFTNVMWGVGRGVVLAQFTPFFEQVLTGLIAQQLAAAGVSNPEAAAQQRATQLAAALPSVVPAQLAGLQGTMLRLDLEKVAAADPAPFGPPGNVVDVKSMASAITQTFEIGYKGIVGRKLAVAVDLYRTKTEDFVGPLGVETPNVFLDGPSLGVALGPAIGAALADDANAEIAAVLAAVDTLNIPGVFVGNRNGTATDDLTSLFAGGVARIPFGTVSPVQASDPTAVILAYRNFGDVTINGLDFNLAYLPNDIWSLSGSYSYVSDDFFPNLSGIADVALNASRHKIKVASSYRLPQWDLQLGARLRYADAFPMNSGVYVGDVDSYTVVDANLVYNLPLQYRAALKLDVSNLLNNEHRESIGAPEIGRLAYLQLGVHF